MCITILGVFLSKLLLGYELHVLSKSEKVSHLHDYWDLHVYVLISEKFSHSASVIGAHTELQSKSDSSKVSIIVNYVKMNDLPPFMNTIDESQHC